MQSNILKHIQSNSKTLQNLVQAGKVKLFCKSCSNLVTKRSKSKTNIRLRNFFDKV